MSSQQLSAPAAKTALGQFRESALNMGTPFSQPILVLENARVAGTPRFMEEADLGAQLPTGTRLELRREPMSRHDPWAIRVLDPDGALLGYLPADVNEILARMMDAGKCLYAKISTQDASGTWNRMYVKVYLDD